jgi:hypothetical protein
MKRTSLKVPDGTVTVGGAASKHAEDIRDPDTGLPRTCLLSEALR